VRRAAGKTTAAPAPTKRRARQVAEVIWKSQSGESAAWFARGIDWALGRLTDTEIEELGLKLPKDGSR
jgi:hypothetical protein